MANVRKVFTLKALYAGKISALTVQVSAEIVYVLAMDIVPITCLCTQRCSMSLLERRHLSNSLA